MAIDDTVVGAIAMDLRKRGVAENGVRVLVAASSVYITGGHRLHVQVPWEYIAIMDAADHRLVLGAARRAGLLIHEKQTRVELVLTPEAPGWRDQLTALSDWSETILEPSEPWLLINERVAELRALYIRAASSDDYGDIGRRCRQLLIAAAKAAHRPWMVPSGQEPPKNDDAKTKIDEVLGVLGTSSLVGRLSKLVDAAWNLAVGTLHNDNAEGPATYALAQATVLIVRELALVEPYIQAREAAATD